MEPSSSPDDSLSLQTGEPVELTVRVLTNGQEVTGVTISMTFDPRFLSVVDSDDSAAGDQIKGLAQLGVVVENQADNDAGTIRYTAGTFSGGPTEDFDLASITFRARDEATPVGELTLAVFVVGALDTGASSVGKQLLRETSDFTGAWIAVAPSNDGRRGRRRAIPLGYLARPSCPAILLGRERGGCYNTNNIRHPIPMNP